MKHSTRRPGFETFDITNNGEEPTQDQRRAVFDGQHPSAQVIAQGIREGKYKNIVVLCGAGMSTSAGIPDFRSPETGVYALCLDYF